MKRYLVSTVPGLEDVAADEAAGLPGATSEPRPFDAAGLVRVTGARLDDLLALTTAHHIVEIRAEARCADLDGIEALLCRADLDELRDAPSFRASTEHPGSDGASRLDVQRKAGGALVRRFGTAVDLEDPAVNVRVDRHGDHVVVGIQHTRTSLHNRLRRAGPLRASLKPTIAAAMLRLAGAHHGPGRLIDPLCGAGTIPIEAKRINPALEVCAADWDPPTVELARATIAHHGVDVDLRLLDARGLAEHERQPFDYIVSDPPYGLRQAKRTSLTRLYRELLLAFERALAPGGKLVLVVLKHRRFQAALEPSGLRVMDERVIETGGLRPRVVRLARNETTRRGEP